MQHAGQLKLLPAGLLQNPPRVRTTTLYADHLNLLLPDLQQNLLRVRITVHLVSQRQSTADL
jgi:hypothetical protein